MKAQANYISQWHDVCHANDLVTNSGVCALIGDTQVAIFKVQLDGEINIFAIDNWDPIGEANVLYRGIVGTLTDKIVVASPLYKEHYDLATGACLERDDIQVSIYSVRVENDSVLI